MFIPEGFLKMLFKPVSTILIMQNLLIVNSVKKKIRSGSIRIQNLNKNKNKIKVLDDFGLGYVKVGRKTLRN